MIDKTLKGEEEEGLQKILADFPENLTGLRKLRHHQMNLHVDSNAKPVIVPPRITPYHLKVRIDKAIKDMIEQDVTEEHPTNQSAPWISCAVIAPKANGHIRVTLDARNLNKAIQSTNLPIPRLKDIKAKRAGNEIFSKLDFRSAFWHIELHPYSRYLTVFHADDKLYRYKRLTMGVKPAQGELNIALKPVVAAKSQEEHDQTILQVMQAISRAGLTWNSDKCQFGKEISFWGMIYGNDGVRPDPEKVEALEHLQAPTNKQELISFLCMMQSNADFIPNFAKKSSKLRELIRGKVRFRWGKEHEQCFGKLIQEFRKDVLLGYFDPNQPIYVIEDGHISGLGAMLAQGDSVRAAKPVAVASRTTNAAEKSILSLILKQQDLISVCIDLGIIW